MERRLATEPYHSARAFERRAERAEALRPGAPEAAEPLAFAAGLCRAQARSAAALEAEHAARRLCGRLDVDCERLLPHTRALLEHAARAGPGALAGAARERLEDDAATARARLLVHWRGGPAEWDYLSRALLRPYLELLRAAHVRPDRPPCRGGCPACGGRPWMGALRGGSPQEGARRLLACGSCGGEWPFGRILCPSCFEGDPRRLPVFTSERHPHVRIEACEVCRRYLKALDLSNDARAIPEIDDLASLALDLWAAEQGFTRIEPGLAGP